MHHGCDVVLLIHHKYASGDTLSFYGTEGAGVSFIGNKNDKQTSEAGQLVLKLFRKSVEGIQTNSNLLLEWHVGPKKKNQGQKSHQSTSDHSSQIDVKTDKALRNYPSPNP